MKATIGVVLGYLSLLVSPLVVMTELGLWRLIF